MMQKNFDDFDGMNIVPDTIDLDGNVNPRYGKGRVIVKEDKEEKEAYDNSVKNQNLEKKDEKSKKNSKKNNKKNNKKKKRRIPIGLKIFIVIIILGLISFGIFSIYMKGQTNPDLLVEKYIKAFMSKDVNAMYEILEFNKSDFINVDNFEKSLEECHSFKEIDSYGLIKSKSDDQSQEYELKFLDGTREVYKTTLSLYKDQPLYFIYDNWKIDKSMFISSGNKVTVPAQAKVFLDGTLLNSKKVKEKTNISKTYEIGDIYEGSHEISMTVEGFDEYKKKFDATSGNKDKELFNITLSMFSISSSTKSKLKKDTKKLIENIYENALNLAEFSEIEKDNAIKEGSRERLETIYNTLLTNDFNPEKTHLSGVKFTTMKSELSPTVAADGQYAIKVKTNATYDTSSVVVNNPESFEEQTMISRTNSNQTDFETIYYYIDGKWYIDSSTAFENSIYYLKY